MTVEQLVGEAMSLPSHTRAYLAEKLLESIDYEEDVKLSEEWIQEAKRRGRELDEGKVSGIPADKVFDEVDDILKDQG